MSENTAEMHDLPTEALTIPLSEKNEAMEEIFDLSSAFFTSITLPDGDTKSVEIKDQPPILSEAEVIAQTKIRLGELVGTIQLPYAEGIAVSEQDQKERTLPLKAYCFKQENVENENEPTYTIIGYPQLRRIKNGGDPLQIDTLTLTKPGDIHFLGRSFWMPKDGYVLPTNPSDEHNQKTQGGTVSRVQASVGMGLKGQLIILTPEDSKNKMTINVGEQRIAPPVT